MESIEHVGAPCSIVMRICKVCDKVVLAYNAVWPTEAERISILVNHLEEHGEEHY